MRLPTLGEHVTIEENGEVYAGEVNERVGSMFCLLIEGDDPMWFDAEEVDEA